MDPRKGCRYYCTALWVVLFSLDFCHNQTVKLGPGDLCVCPPRAQPDLPLTMPRHPSFLLFISSLLHGSGLQDGWAWEGECPAHTISLCQWRLIRPQHLRLRGKVVLLILLAKLACGLPPFPPPTHPPAHAHAHAHASAYALNPTCVASGLCVPERFFRPDAPASLIEYYLSEKTRVSGTVTLCCSLRCYSSSRAVLDSVSTLVWPAG